MVQSSETEGGSSEGGFAPVFVQGIPVGPPPQSTKFRLRVKQHPSSDTQDRSSQRPKRQPRPKRVIEIGAGPQHLSRAQRSVGRLTMETMEEHLAKLFIGYRAGDTSAPELPDDLPPPTVRMPLSSGAPSVITINLNTMSQEELAAEASATGTGKEVFLGLLQNPPPIPRSRVARYTGQDSVHAGMDGTEALTHPGGHSAHENALDDNEYNRFKNEKYEEIVEPAFDDVSLQILHSHLSTNRHVSWQVLGFKEPVYVGGVELSLLKMWQKVEDMGGYARVTAEKKWTWLAMAMGIEPSSNNKAGYNIKNIYAKYLLPYEIYLQENPS